MMPAGTSTLLQSLQSTHMAFPTDTEIGARIDMFRGICADDWLNSVWNVLFHKLTYYRAWVADNSKAALNRENRANTVEMLTGIAYACFRTSAFGGDWPGVPRTPDPAVAPG